MEKYAYNTLSQPRSIRVIELHPSPKATNPLSIHLREIILSPTSKFSALSYSWESQSFTQPLSCDGKQLLITPTCEAALRRLRLAKQPRILWIDQICINQETVEEKNQQVALMGDLYSIAENVIVWLGVNLAADKLLEYVNLYRLFGMWKKVPLAGRLQYHMRFKWEQKLLDKVQVQLPALHPISWFNRMWTIQEVALAKQVQVLSLRRTMDYDHFISSLSLWLTERLNQPTGGDLWGHIMIEGDTTTQLLSARKDIRSLLHPDSSLPYHKQKEAKSHITELVCHITAASASVASDKIFALYGLLSSLGISLPEPDYNVPTSEVYWRAACAIMKSQNCLDMFSLVNTSPTFTDVPSWTPDFNRSSARWEMHSAWFHASGYEGRQKPDFSFIEVDRVMVTKAKIIDVVKGVVPGKVDDVVHIIGLDSDDVFFGNSLSASIRTIEVFQSWIRAALKLRSSPAIWRSPPDPVTMVVHQSGNLITEALALMMQPNPEVERMNEVIGFVWMSVASPRDIWMLYQAAIASGKFPRKLLENPGFVLREDVTEFQMLLVLIDRGLYDCFLDAWRKAVGNVFLVTRDGCIGTGPVAVKEGDVVALIPGVRTPMILRALVDAVPDRYHVIGPAFINGVMEGERWDDHLSLEERGKNKYAGHDLPDISLE